DVENIRFLILSNLKTYAPKHYVNIGLIADWKSGEPKVMEPDRVESWAWYEMDNFPQPLFSTIPSYVEALKIGVNFVDH
ncbi:DNA mismatch repair protein MutT, partial [Candidatus Parcubacteria bacterium]|nr:DNA mismatch repair protein MutT [Candidatus Parcubacteria bacterium]